MVSDGLKSFLFQKVVFSVEVSVHRQFLLGSITVPHGVGLRKSLYFCCCQGLCKYLQSPRYLSALDKSSIADESNSKNTSGTILQPLSKMS